MNLIDKKKAAAQQLHIVAISALSEINKTVPLHGVLEWIHLRQKLALLIQATDPGRKPVFRPTPPTFGTAEPVEQAHEQLTLFDGVVVALIRELEEADVPTKELELFMDCLTWAEIHLEAYGERQRMAQALGATVPLLVPPGLIPPMNHFTRWMSGDGSKDLEAFTRGLTKPDMSPMPFRL